MRWATRRHCHVDRAACAWLIRRFIDQDAEFVFVDDADEVPDGATPFDMRGVELSHHDGDCSFETFSAPLRARRSGAVGDRRRPSTRPTSPTSASTRPEAPGLDVAAARPLDGASTTSELLALTRPLFDGLYEYRKRALLTGREPA